MHDDPLLQCQEAQRRIEGKIDRHTEDSMKYRSMVDVQDSKILTLEAARVDTMNDIKQIKESLADLQSSINNMNASVKIWVLGGVISTMVVFAIPVCSIIYTAGVRDNKINETVRRVEILENGCAKKAESRHVLLGD